MSTRRRVCPVRYEQVEGTMAIPKKSGLRKIKIGPIEYYWNFRTDYSTKTIRIRVGEVEDQNTSLLVEAYHVDRWLNIGESDTKHNEIEIRPAGK